MESSNTLLSLLLNRMKDFDDTYASIEEVFNALDAFESSDPLREYSIKDSQRELVLDRVLSIVAHCFRALANDKFPTIKYRSGQMYMDDSPNECLDFEDPKDGFKFSSGVLSLRGRSSKNLLRCARFFRVAQLVCSLLKANKTSTKRDIFYADGKVFGKQINSDKAIELLARICNVPRFQLNIVSYSKGLVYGALVMKDLQGNLIHCHSGPTTLPSELFVDQAHALFVVEKECIFRRLCDGRAILLTGCGYPDVQTRILLSRLSKSHPNLPIYGIADWDPDGVEIILTYAFGSHSREHEREFLRCPTMRWLGLHSNDMKVFGVPKALRLELSSRDRARISRMCERKVIKENPRWRNELEEMLIQDSKYEIECLNAISQGGSNSLSNLSNHYIHDKICRFDYLTLNFATSVT
ncbi:meiosis-specific transesterase [Guillardia theta CCMP2712]|uniref:DNA topoisomerase (ATP-hydrolyzing) n=1 Tax=Guillardia theta (strain CCMP2712) TaxID=905079 RepID=L1IKF1_GUITC|nr:meiosis-specific transesterase [Guillardia theta CCMP2712]EKX36265.1 meiosis-specific transesterase [Guillardia theta CCMP2712]|eukprot:XP_005823245.1 meiosis-specific transesterase [Guillardia theta CCMP2712]